MAYTLSNLLQDAYRKLGQLNESTATGGTTTTIVDSKLAGEGGDDDWLGGAAFIVYDAGGASAAPEGEFSRISDYADASGTFTVSTLGAAPAAGDRYAYTSELFPLNDMISLANGALQTLGTLSLTDTTTLDTVASQTEYDYAIEWKRNPPTQVDYQGRTDDANDNQWIEISKGAWEYIPAAAGSTGLLVIPQLPESRDIRVWYEGPHPYIQAYDDPVDEGIEPELAVAALVHEALQWQNSRLQGGDEFLLMRENKAQQQLLEAKAMYPIWKPNKDSGLLILGRRTAQDEFDWPDAP